MPSGGRQRRRRSRAKVSRENEIEVIEGGQGWSRSKMHEVKDARGQRRTRSKERRARSKEGKVNVRVLHGVIAPGAPFTLGRERSQGCRSSKDEVEIGFGINGKGLMGCTCRSFFNLYRCAAQLIANSWQELGRGWIRGVGAGLSQCQVSAGRGRHSWKAELAMASHRVPPGGTYGGRE